MTSNNSSRMEVPQAKEAMNKFKMEVASEIGVPLKNGGYNGDLTSAQNGSVGGYMVKSARWLGARKKKCLEGSSNYF